MKNLTLLIIITICTFFNLTAQSVPQGMNYQAAARDAKGQILGNKEVSLRIRLLAGGPAGKVLYSELHDVITNSLGLFDLVIGQGMPESGAFVDIPWSKNEVWMELALDENNHEKYIPIGSNKLMAVPYALHAGTATALSGGRGKEKSGGNWQLRGNSGIDEDEDYLGTSDDNPLSIRTNGTERMRVDKTGGVSIHTNLDVAGNVNAASFTGDGSGLTGINVSDGDADPTNELQDWSSLPGIPADIADGDQVDDGDADPTNELQDWSSLPGIPADIADGDQVDDADADPTNELQDWSNLPGIPSDLTDGDDVEDADADPTNELQDWSTLPGIPTDIADGDQVDDADADPTNELEMPNASRGDMAYFSGSSWQRIPAGTDGKVLTMSGGVPVWASPSEDGSGEDNGDIGSLFQVALPDGGSLFVHPTEFEIPQVWGSLTGLPDITDVNSAIMDFNGITNTSRIWIDSDPIFGYPSYAALICKNMVAFGFEDWYLPAAGELNVMYQQLGQEFSGNYWSSTQFDDTAAWMLDTNFGGIRSENKATEIHCRCVRR